MHSLPGPTPPYLYSGSSEGMKMKLCNWGSMLILWSQTIKFSFAVRSIWQAANGQTLEICDYDYSYRVTLGATRNFYSVVAGQRAILPCQPLH